MVDKTACPCILEDKMIPDTLIVLVITTAMTALAVYLTKDNDDL